MICPSCKKPVAAGANHCIHCGDTLPVSSPGGPPGESIPSYLVPAILATIFCCVPFGIVAIVFAAQVGTRLDAGDYAGARDASRKARLWCIVSLVLGLLVIFISFGLFVVLGLAGARGY
jgi:hypothetical protein